MKPASATPLTDAAIKKNAHAVRDLCCKLEAELTEALKDAQRWRTYCQLFPVEYIEELTMKIDREIRERK
jgi:hypothetical protein